MLDIIDTEGDESDLDLVGFYPSFDHNTAKVCVDAMWIASVSIHVFNDTLHN